MVGLNQRLRVGQALSGVKAVVIVDELDCAAVKATGIVVGLERSFHAGVERNADRGESAGRSRRVADKDRGVVHALHRNEGRVAVALGRGLVSGSVGGIVRRGVGGLVRLGRLICGFVSRGARLVGQAASAGRQRKAECEHEQECQQFFHVCSSLFFPVFYRFRD